MPKKVYISGQITGLSHDEYTNLFGLAEASLLNLDYDPINPLKLAACEGEDCNRGGLRKDDGTFLHSWECYLKYDIKAMLDCDGIVMLPNWHNSRGAVFELDVASKCGLKVFYMDNDYRKVRM